MQNKAILYWLWLVMVMGVSNRQTVKLAKQYKNPQELYDALHVPDTVLVDKAKKKDVMRYTLEQAENIYDSCCKNKIGIITWDSLDYPETLRNLYDPPAVLFYRGDISLLRKQNLLTVVGTRRPSNYSVYVAERLCNELAQHGVILVSGCAVGLDSVAHQAAVNQGMPTVGILGCGIDYDYPKDNRMLRERILENGLLLTEYFPGTQPAHFHFPIRNRLLAGVSEAVLLIEASSRSGAMITANEGCNQGKTVFCIPPADIYDMRYAGQAGLLRDGAYPVFDFEDILTASKMTAPEKSMPDMAELPDATEKPEIAEAFATTDTTAISEMPETEEAPEIFPPEAVPEQQEIIRILRKGKQSSNMLCSMLGIRFEKVVTYLVEMEMMGWIVNTGRDVYALTDSLQ